MLEPPPPDIDVDDDPAKHRFFNWLKTGDGIFWVSDKAGSDKSTLMKFLADHETTQTMLEEWAKPFKLLTARHYFWAAGTHMQKSHEGLLKTLYDILCACPSLLPAACPLR